MKTAPVKRRMVFLVGLPLLLLVLTAMPARASHNLWRSGDRLHWEAFSWGQQITVVDRTQPWPVSTATSNWNTAFHPGLVHYHWWNCTHGVNCFFVHETNDANQLYIGAAFFQWDVDGHFTEGETFVNLNNFYVPDGCGGASASDCRRHTACQEIGHALGLDHQQGPSCMDDTNAFTKLIPEYSNSGHDDHDALHDAYDHGYHG